MTTLKALLAATIVAAVVPLAGLRAEPAAGDKDALKYKGWGLAIAYLAIGEKCKGALSVDQMTHLQSYVANGLAYSRQNDKAFDHEKFVDTFHDEMVAKYANPGNCTPAVVKEARDAAATAEARISKAD